MNYKVTINNQSQRKPEPFYVSPQFDQLHGRSDMINPSWITARLIFMLKSTVICTRRGNIVGMLAPITTHTGASLSNKEFPHCGLMENWQFRRKKSLERVTCVCIATVFPATCTSCDIYNGKASVQRAENGGRSI